MKTHLFWYMAIGPRDTQEDCLMFCDKSFQLDHGYGAEILDEDSFLAAVCDGLGGHDAGEIASRFFCDNLIIVDPELSYDEIHSHLRMIQLKSSSSIPLSCGTTLAGIKKSGDKILVFNAGDSRVYHISDNARIVSHDHSYVQEMLEKGLITCEQAVNHPYKNIVTFGMGPVFEKNEGNREIFFSEIQIRPGESMLICSDGVSDALANAVIFNASEIPAACGENLVNYLEELGIRDNASFIYLWFE